MKLLGKILLTLFHLAMVAVLAAATVKLGQATADSIPSGLTITICWAWLALIGTSLVRDVWR